MKEELEKLFPYAEKSFKEDLASFSQPVSLKKGTMIGYPGAVCEEDVLGYVTPAEKANYLFEKYSYWRNFVLDMVVKNVYGLFLVLNELISKRVDQRLVEYIKNNAKGNLIKATHEEIARDIGTAREVVSRLLKELEREGYLEITRGENKNTKTHPLA